MFMEFYTSWEFQNQNQDTEPKNNENEECQERRLVQYYNLSPLDQGDVVPSRFYQYLVGGVSDFYKIVF